MRQWWQISISVNPEFYSSRQRVDAAAIPAGVWRAIAYQSILGVNHQWMLARIEAPTLLVWGGRDSLATPAGRQLLRAGVKNCKVKTFNQLGHDLFCEVPISIAGVLSDFLEHP